MRLLTITLFVMLIYQVSWAQKVIEGTVRDADNKEVLVGAAVQIEGTQQGTVTDEQGRFSLSSKQATVKLKFSYVGYNDTKVTWQGAELNVLLVPASMEEVVIRGIRGSDKTPVTQKTIDKKEIEEVYVGQDAAFLTEKLTPSIVAYSESGTNYTNYGQMRLRGIDQTRINITLDGVPLNDMMDQGVFFSNFTDFGNSVESFQVQRGVGTSTNGTASYAGSINYESIALDKESPSVELQVSGGSFNTWRGSVELQSGLLENNFAFYSRISLLQSDGYKYHSGTDSYSFFFSGAHYGEKDVFKLTAFKGKTKNDMAYQTVPESVIEDDPRTNPLSSNDTDEFGQWLIKLQHTHAFSDKLNLASTLYYGGAGGPYPYGYDEQLVLYTGDPDNPADTVSRFTQINYPMTNDHYGLLSNISWQINSALDFNAGIHAYTFLRNNKEQIIPDYNSPYYDESSHKDEFSAFAKATYTLGKLSIYGDLQYRTVKLTIEPDESYLGFESDDIVWNWNFVNPRIGVNYEFNTSNSMYASFGRSGREPTKVDILGGYELTADNYDFVADDNSVKPEYVNDLEIGYRLEKQRIQLMANFFYMDFDNEIAAIGETVAEGFVQLRKNMPESYRSGVELDWKWKLSPVVSFLGNATYMKSEIEEYAPDYDGQVYHNVTPVLSPEWMANGTIALTILPNLGIDISGRYVGESYLEPTNQEEFTMPGFFILNSNINYRFGKHSLSVAVNNITDKLYYTYGLPQDVDYDGTYDESGYLVQSPISAYATLTLRF